MNTKYVSSNPVSRYLIRGFMRSLVELAAQLEPERALDIGCGEGLVLRQLRAVWRQSDLHGLDMDARLLDVASAVAPNAKYVCGNLLQLPLPDHAYDVVICTEVLEHVEQPDVALRELARVSGDYCLISVPHEPWWRLSNVARGSYWQAWGNTPGHVNHWTLSACLDFVRSCLDVVAIRTPYPWVQILARTRT